jgi:tryptophan synthase beta chain
MELAGESPDVIIGCVGGGSNFAGLSFPFVERVIKSGAKHRILAVEPTACPTMTKGELRYDHGDTAGMTPLLMMDTLGHTFMPPPIHAGGLRYHGMAPMISHLHKLGILEARALPQTHVFKSAVEFARAEGIVAAPESAHAVAAAMDEAKAAKEAGEKRVILLGLSGHGMLDLSSYEAFLEGQLQDV